MLILLTLMMMILSCCGEVLIRSEDIHQRIYKTYRQLETYQAKITVIVTSNKTTKEYVMNQWYKYPNKFKMMLLEPEGFNGLVTIYNKGKIVTVHPDMQGAFILHNYTPVDKGHLFLTDFFENYYKSQQTSMQTFFQGQAKYTVLKADIPGGHAHRVSQAMWIDNETCLPFKMEIYDDNNKPVITIIYEDIKLNVPMKEEIFEISE